MLGRGNQDRDIGRYKENLARYLSLNDARFNHGRSHYQTIAIPGYNADMSSLSMQKLFLNEQLNKEQMGALSHYIDEAMHKEWRQETIRLLPVVTGIFRHHNPCFTRLVPQDFLLSLMGQDSGLCNQLAIMMSLVITKGERVINAVIDQLFRLASAGQDSLVTKKFLSSLRQVHLDRRQMDVAGASATEKYSLGKVVEKLSHSTTTKMYRLSTKTHALLAGVDVAADGVNTKTFYFYDPNWGVYGFRKKKSYLQALISFFNVDVNGQAMSRYYAAFSSQGQAKFELRELNLNNIANQPWEDNQTIGSFLSTL